MNFIISKKATGPCDKCDGQGTMRVTDTVRTKVGYRHSLTSVNHMFGLFFSNDRCAVSIAFCSKLSLLCFVADVIYLGKFINLALAF